MAQGDPLSQTVRIKLPSGGALSEAGPRPAGAAAAAAPASGVLPLEGVRAKLNPSEYTLYRELLQSFYDAVLVTDWAGGILDSNHRAVDFFRYNAAELRQRSILDLVYGLDEAVLGQIRDGLDRNQFTLIEEAYCRRKDQSLFPAEIATNSLHLDDEKHICLFVRDISRRKHDEELLRQTRDQLARAERLEMAGSLAGHIAHDFNNLLTPLLAYPDLIAEELPPDSRARDDLAVIAKTARQIADINQQLLALSRRAYHEQAVLNIHSVIETEAALLARTEEARLIQVDLQLADDLLNMKGSSQQLLRVIQNLCQNALEAMKAGGTLTIRTANVYLDKPVKKYDLLVPGEYIKVSIADTGHGIPPDIQEKIFDPFFTTRKADKKRGSGLGLSVVRGIVQDHKGFIDVESALGEGTTFSLYFPTSREELPAANPETSLRGTETILAIDDDPLQISVVSRLLKSLGYTVEGALSGEAALQAFNRHKADGRFPDLVILDMVMGTGMDGAQTFRELRAINPAQKAIIVSGYAESPRVNLAQSLGAGAYLRKPVTIEKLSKAVRAELDKA